jgi:probable biosynthetic protein (TIGR04098 family)
MTSELFFELGMPHLGRNNLNENALFKVVGHDRWLAIERAGGMKSSEIRDEDGRRLFATFYFLELALSPERPLGFYGENQRLSFRSDLCRHGQVYIDGRYEMVEGGPFSIRASNVFIHQNAGPSRLSLSPAANLCFASIPELDSQPDSLDLCRAARQAGTFLPDEPGQTTLGTREVIYQLDADRDMNGAGLVYFANFICFLDRAERELLRESGISEPQVDARSTFWRRIGYFGNAEATDRLHIAITARIQASHPQLILAFDYRVLRSSDGKEIVVSSARKVFPPTTA